MSERLQEKPQSAIPGLAKLIGINPRACVNSFKSIILFVFLSIGISRVLFAADPGESIEYIGILGQEWRVSSIDGITITGNDRLSTPVKFKPPVEISIIAKTDSTNIRLHYAADQLIFNWEVNKQELRVDGGPAGGKHQPGAGSIPKDKYVTFKWVVTPQKQEVYVDDQLRFEHTGDYSRIDKPVSVSTHDKAHVTVKSIKVTQLSPGVLTAQNGAASGGTPAPTGGWAGAADLVKTYRNSLVFVNGTNGAGSGFIATLAGASFLFTNAHVSAGVRGAAFKTLDGAQVQGSAASVAVGHDIFRVQAGSGGKPFDIMQGVDENAAIDDEIVVLGNAEGAGVVNTIKGKIVGIGPNLVEVDAPFVPGNSGSPIIHLKSGKVVGVATYLIIKKYDAATKEVMKAPVIRRFGYRLDSVKAWQPVNWQAFYAQAVEMEKIEALTDDLADLIRDLARNKRITLGAHTNPVIKARIDAWVSDRSHRLSPKDLASVNQNFVAFLKIACQTDVTSAKQRLTFDYFVRALADQQQARNEISEVFDRIIKDIQTDR